VTEIVDTVVIGAGVVGLALGRQLALDGRQVIVLDKHANIGEETSSRNSEVIHAGIYYAPGSLKAKLCVAGKEALYRYCEVKGVAYARCGKLIVAVDSKQQAALTQLEQRALANGVTDLSRLDASEVSDREPEVRATAALWSPSTGIIDSHGLMLALQGDLEHAGGIVALHSECRSGSLDREGIRLRVSSAGETSELLAKTVVNAGGLHASRVAQSLPGTATIPATGYAKGSYFVYQGPSPFKHLVYPLPQEGGLGIHATLDLAGRLRFGPDVEWVDAVDYTLDPGRAASFYAAIRSYWPALPEDSLSPGYVGIRPKLQRPGEPPADFCILGPITCGRGRIMHLLGIESPGLTASLAIASYTADALAKAD